MKEYFSVLAMPTGQTVGFKVGPLILQSKLIPRGTRRVFAELWVVSDSNTCAVSLKTTMAPTQCRGMRVRTCEVDDKQKSMSQNTQIRTGVQNNSRHRHTKQHEKTRIQHERNP